MELSVPSTICSTIGIEPARAAALRLRARDARSWHRIFGLLCTCPGTDDQNAVRVDFEVLAREHHSGGAEFLDDRRSGDPGAGRQHAALIDRGCLRKRRRNRPDAPARGRRTTLRIEP